MITVVQRTLILFRVQHAGQLIAGAKDLPRSLEVGITGLFCF